jgi:hypothetical protein
MEPVLKLTDRFVLVIATSDEKLFLVINLSACVKSRRQDGDGYVGLIVGWHSTVAGKGHGNIFF